MPYIDGLPTATAVFPTDLIAIDQGGTAGIPGTATTRQATLAQVGSGNVSFIVNAAPFLNAGTVVSGTTITAASLAAQSLIGLGGTTAAVPGAIGLTSDLTITAGNSLALTNTGTAGGPFNSFSVSATGRITNGASVSYLTSNQTITLSGAVTGSGTAAIITSMPSIIAAGTSGSAGRIPIITTGTNGLITGITTVAVGVTGAASGAGLNSGNVIINGSATVSPTAGATITLSPLTGTSDILVNLPTTGGTVTVGYAGAFPRQRMEIDWKQGATASVVVLNSGTIGGFVYGTSPPAFTITPTANLIDMMICIAPGTSYTRVVGLDPGFSV